MRIAIFGNNYQDRHLTDIGKLFACLRRKGVEISVERNFYSYLSALLPDIQTVEIIDSADFTADMAISIGGDGTFLRTAARVGRKQIPIVGINTGHLGYLAEISIGEFEEMLDEFAAGKYSIEQRSLIEAIAADGIALPGRFALNEVAIQKNASTSMLQMDTTVNGNRLTSYLGDGLIVATPTGSTAYNLSVGGPILHPASSSFVVSPIAAHSLTMRPLVIPDNMEVAITTVSDRSKSFRISIDGVSASLPTGTEIRLHKAPFPIRLLQRNNHDFARILRNKLMWGADAR